MVVLSTSARDPFSTPCEKAIPEPYYPFLITISHLKYLILVVSIGIQLQVSVTVGQAIDRCFLPCRGDQLTHHARLTPAGHTFLGHARPWPNNTPQPDLGLAKRSPSVYILSTPGFGPIARCTPGHCVQGGSRLHLYMDGAGPTVPQC